MQNLQLISIIHTVTNFNIKYKEILIAIVLCILLVILRKKISKLVMSIVMFFIHKTELILDQYTLENFKKINTPIRLFVVSIVFWVLNYFESIPDKLEVFSLRVFWTIISIGIIQLIYISINIFSNYIKFSINKKNSSITPVFIEFFKYGTKSFIFVIGIFIVTKNWGLDLTGILATVGFFSLAISLAAKDTVANIFGGISVIFDTPYVIGDTISIGNIQGTVENITFRNTRIRTFDQSIVFIPNQLTATTATINHSKKMKRPLNLTINIPRKVSIDHVNKILINIKNKVSEFEQVVNNIVMIHIDEISENLYDIRLTCHVTSIKHQDFINIKEKISIHILEIINSFNYCNENEVRISKTS